eukprot:633656-Hanusia_phi.AAC.2
MPDMTIKSTESNLLSMTPAKHKKTIEEDDVMQDKSLPAAETGKCNTEQTDSVPNLYSDISESFLSDPQDAGSIEDIFGEANLSWSLSLVDEWFSILMTFSRLVEPLTNHINAKLNESHSAAGR